MSFWGVVAIEFLVRCDALSEEAFSLMGSLKDAVVLVSLSAKKFVTGMGFLCV